MWPEPSLEYIHETITLDELKIEFEIWPLNDRALGVRWKKILRNKPRPLGNLPKKSASIINIISKSTINKVYSISFLRLAIFMRENIPDAHIHDPELFTLEIMLLSRIKEQKIPLHVIMNEDPPSDSTSGSSSYDDDQSRPIERRSFDFTARIPNKNLRCVNINWCGRITVFLREELWWTCTWPE